MWTLVEGVTLANRLESALIKKGFHCAFGGSVLHRGTSTKDLDIFIYPHQCAHYEVDWANADSVLEQCGCEFVRSCEHKYDKKRVKEARMAGKRIDFFFVS